MFKFEYPSAWCTLKRALHPVDYEKFITYAEEQKPCLKLSKMLKYDDSNFDEYEDLTFNGPIRDFHKETYDIALMIKATYSSHFENSYSQVILCLFSYLIAPLFIYPLYTPTAGNIS
jgi:hypothetical protein